LRIVAGTITDSGAATPNKARPLIGGASDLGDAAGNKVLIEGGTIALKQEGGQIVGGTSWGTSSQGSTGTVSGNYVKISGDSAVTANDIFGGHIDGHGTVSGNHVDIELKTGGSVTAYGPAANGQISGAFTRWNGNALEVSVLDANYVSIVGGTIETVKIGGSIVHGNGTVQGSDVTVKGGSITLAEGAYGGQVSGAGSATNNHVEITGGQFSAQNPGGAYTIFGGYVGGSGAASGNAIIVTGTEKTFGDKANLVGGYSNGGEVKSNTIELKNVHVNSVIAGQSNSATNDEVSGNTIKIENVVFEGALHGGLGTANNIVKNNIITIAGGMNKFKSDIFIGGNLEINDSINYFYGEIDTATVAGIEENGTIKIVNGTNNFYSSVNADNDINITGGDSIFKGDLTASGAISVVGDGATVAAVKFAEAGLAVYSAGELAFQKAQIVLTQGATFRSALPAAGAISFGQGSALDLGTNTLALDGKTVFENATIDFNTDTSNYAQISSNESIVFSGANTFNIHDVLDDPESWNGKTIVSTTNPTEKITGIENIDALFYTLAYVDNRRKIVVAKDSFFVTAAEKLDEAGLVRSTPNIIGAATLMDKIAASKANPDLVGVLISAMDDIRTLAASDPAQADMALRQLVGESMVNTLAAVDSTAQKTQSVVFGRLDRVREAGSGSLVPPSAGSGGELSRLWAGGFGVWAEADNRDDVYGYDYSAHGAALGYDRSVAALPGLRVGVSAIFAKGGMDNNDNLTEADLDTVGLGVYGSCTLPNGIFFDASVAYGRTATDYTTENVTGGTARGSFDIDSWQFGLRAGAVLKAGTFQFIPSVGVRYTHFKQHGWTETLSAAALATNSAPHLFGARSDKRIDVPVQLKINTSLEAGSFVITPELRLGATFTAKKPDNAMTVGFSSSDLRNEIAGVRPHSATFNAGLGLKISTGSLFDAYVNYDFDAASGFTSHNLSVGVGIDY
jgi:uncharacterized protein with beta-barrel porin domain